MSAAALEMSYARRTGWRWPIDITGYDRASTLSRCEREALINELPGALRGHQGRRTSYIAQIDALIRLRKPIEDATRLMDYADPRPPEDAMRLLLNSCSKLGCSFWAWDEPTWRSVLGVTPKQFNQFHDPLKLHPASRQAAIATAYLLRCFTNVASLKEVQWVGLAQRVFGKDRIISCLEPITTLASQWGYHKDWIFRSFIAEALLAAERPDLESLSAELIARVTHSRCSDRGRDGISYRLRRLLGEMGILPANAKAVDEEYAAVLRERRVANVPPYWTAAVERWEALTVQGDRCKIRNRAILFKMGRWSHAEYPQVSSLDEWTRDMAVHYVSMVSNLTIGEHVTRTVNIRSKLGKPTSVGTKVSYLQTPRRFFGEIQEWGWITRRFDPRRVFRPPRAIRSMIGPAPRTIADESWAKLLWAGLNLTTEDFSPSVRNELINAGLRAKSLGPSHYPLEMMQALAIVWLFAGLRSDEIVRLRVGCARPEPSPQRSPNKRACWMLDVPVNKTFTAFTKPVDAVVGEAIKAWEAVRPDQPTSIDAKTGEQVHVLFSVRARSVSRAYLNLFLIPILCHKAGVPRSDSRGRLTSHRARATIATQLFTARDPMSLDELQAWLGHRNATSTQHYVAFTPTRLAKAYKDAAYFQRNLRMIDVLIDQDAVRQGAGSAPWRYYDLGHGLCSYDFFDQCPHRMACAKCDFYIPKDSSRAQLLESKTGIVRMLQEIPLTDEERLAVEGDKGALEKLLTRLEAVPVPRKSLQASSDTVVKP